MRHHAKTYNAPSLTIEGDAVRSTRVKIAGDHEPGTLQPKAGAGDVGFGL